MTDTQKNAIAQAAERLFDFADDFIPQPTPKAAQDFTDPENYWHQAALAALPQPAPVTGGEDVERQAALVARLRAAGEPVHDRIWLHGIGDHSGEVTWANEPDPSGEPEEAEWAVEYVLAALSTSAPEAPSEREADRNLERLIADLRSYAEPSSGSLRIDMSDVKSILALYDRARKIGGAS